MLMSFPSNGRPQCGATWYNDTVRHVASWGYVLVQYTVNFTTFLSTGDRSEVTVVLSSALSYRWPY